MEILEGEGNREDAEGKFNRVDLLTGLKEKTIFAGYHFCKRSAS